MGVTVTRDDAPFTGEWRSIAGAPATCGVLIASSAAQSVTAMTWTPCPSGRPGCRLLVTDWGQSDYARVIDFIQREPVRIINGVPYLVYQRSYPQQSSWSAFITVAQPIDGPPAFALGVRNDASLCDYDVGLSDEGIGVRLTARKPAPQAFGFAPWSSLVSLAVRQKSAADLGIGTTAFARSVALSEGRMFLDVDPAGGIVFDPACGGVQRPGALIESPIAVPGGALYSDFQAAFSIGFLRADGAYSVLVAPTTPQQISGFAIDRSGTPQLVWVESDGQGPYANSVIWTAPFAQTAAQIQRRRVAGLNDSTQSGGSRVVANRGVVLSVTGDAVATITRLSDGTAWTITAENGLGFVYPIWIDDDEAWLSVAKVGSPNFRAYQSGIMRIRRDSLAPPK